MALPRIRVLPDPEAVAAAAAELVMETAALAIERAGRFSIALSGGSTPRLLYQRLADDPYRAAIDWAKVRVFFSDERCVPPGHSDSNFRMASEALLDAVPIPYEQVHRMRGEVDPQAGAKEYGELLQRVLGDEGVDLCLLGIGPDAHTASLFPHTAALRETHHRCVANYVEKLSAWRLTLTAAFINRSYHVSVLATGAEKSLAVQAALEGEANPEEYPIQLIDPAGEYTWLMDVQAAGMV